MARILLMEDNRENLELMRYLLNAFGHRTATARNGDEGLQAARAEPPDLIVCDIQMPGLDGFGVIRALRADEDLRSIPCIAVTALAMPEDRERVRAAGFAGYISKPIEPESFVADVEAFLQAKPVAAPCILVADDRPTNREYLVSLLGYAGYRLLEASHGAEALNVARAEHPDLILTDILMPTMDGFELVQNLRADPSLQATKVIFYSATYSVPDAEAMAAACGVRTVLPKPADPQVILEAVRRELGLDAQPSLAGLYAGEPARAIESTPLGVNPLDEGIEASVAEMRAVTRRLEELAREKRTPNTDQEILRPLSHRFARSLESLQRTSSRLTALEDLNLRLMAHHQPGAMIEVFVDASARILGAARAAVCILDPGEAKVAHLATRGVDAGLLRGVALNRGRLPGSLLDARAPVRHAGFSTPVSGLTEVSETGRFLGLPIGRGGQLHGWMFLADETQGRAFTPDDQHFAESMAARLAAIYEHTLLYNTVQRHAARLQLAASERERSRTQLLESEQRFRQIAENIREVFWLTDPAKNEMLYISPAYDEIWGRKGETLYATPLDWLAAIHPEDLPWVIEAARLKQGLGTYDEQYRIVRPDGSIRWIHDRAFPVTDESGAVYRIAGVAEDITQKRQAEAEILRSQRALRMLSSCNEALVRITDEQALLDRICRLAVEEGGYRIARVGFALNDEARSLDIKAFAGDLPDFLRQMPIRWAAREPEGEGPVSRAMRSGEVVVVSSLAEVPALAHLGRELEEANLGCGVYLPLKDGRGSFGVLVLTTEAGVVVQDDELRLLRELAEDLAFGVSTIRARGEKERSDAALLSSLREKEALLKEVHHRVKNNMQVITSLLRLESGRIDHEQTRTVLKQMQNRIFSMALLHETLYRSSNLEEVDLAVYLRQLSGQLIRSLADSRGQMELHLDLAPLALDMDQAVPCGLIVNELVSNALKHAFPDERRGAVWIDLHQTGEGTYRLRVRDNGVGLPRDFESRRSRSLGLQLVSDLAKQLRGQLSVGPESVFEVTFAPAPARKPF